MQRQISVNVSLICSQAAQSARESGIEMLTFGVDGFLNELQAITGNVEEAIFSFDNADFSNDENLKQKLEGAASYICAGLYVTVF